MSHLVYVGHAKMQQALDRSQAEPHHSTEVYVKKKGRPMPVAKKPKTPASEKANTLAAHLLRGARAAMRMLTRPSQVSIDGLKLPIDPDLCSPAIRRQIYFETYEQDERRVIPGLIRPGDRVLELGAGIGLVTATIARAAPAASLHIEANRDLIPAITNTLKANDLAAEVRQAAIVGDDFNGDEIDLLTGAEFWSSSLHHRDSLDQSVKVAAIRLSDVLAEFRPTVLVIDVEGAECDLLTGAALTKVRAIAVEMHARITGVAAQSRMFQSLLGAGFHIDFTTARNETVILFRVEDGA